MSLSSLPTTFIEDGFLIAEQAKIFGVSFLDLTREEAIAVAAHGWHNFRNTENVLFELRKRVMLDHELISDIVFSALR